MKLLVILVGALYKPIPWNDAEHSMKKLRPDNATLLLSMVVVAFSFLADRRRALLGSIVQRMVLQFLPPMTHIAVELVLTSIHRIVVDQFLGLPVGTGLT